MQYDFKRIEQEVKKYWDEKNIPHRIANFELREGRRKFYLLDGPPYANASPHAGHALTIVFKDLWGKFKFMDGHAVWFQPGFDCHGLPIENMVEKKFGIKSKKDIEGRIGVEKFIKMCRDYATQNLEEWMKYYRDLAAWKGWLKPYLTYEPYYIESIWWTIKRLFDSGLMVRGKKPIHWCPRCQTSISGYEATDSYKNVSDPSVYVKFRIKNRKNEFLLVWTTTPWTLPANVVLVVHPEETYVKVEVGNEFLILAEKLLEDVMERAGIDHYRVVEKFRGKDLEGLSYEPLLQVPLQRDMEKNERVHRVVVSVPILKKVVASKVRVKKEIEGQHDETFGHMVTMDTGTGIVHCAPGHGAEDNKLGAHYNLPSPSPVDDEGRFTGEAGWLEGMFVKDADAKIIEHLDERGLLFHAEKIFHSYPLCWRCKTPLIYRATDQWFFRIDPIKKLMLRFVDQTRWLPEFARERMKNWIEQEEDWCISTQRYWGAPIPIWECKNCGNLIAIGSREELEQKMVNDICLDDLHKHVVDKVLLRCDRCGSEMHRIPDIINIWVESGVAPWASLGYPYIDGDLFKKLWRVDLVDESQDQIRGWFHAMLFMAAATFKDRPYETVCMNGWVLDEKGEKMSKSLGNVIPAEQAFKELGADVLRLYCCYSTAPWDTHKFSMSEAKELFSFMNVVSNIVNLMEIYSIRVNLDHVKPERVEDRWILSRLNTTISNVREHINNFYFHYAARELINFFLEEFSRFYLKLAKKRLDEKIDERTVHHVVSRVLYDTMRMLAPFCPYITEYVYLKIFKPVVNVDSIHLLEYPKPDGKLVDTELEKQMRLVQKIIEAVLSMRQEANIKLRWPLREFILMRNEMTEKVVEKFGELLKQLTNVKSVSLGDIKLEYEVKPNYAVIGPKFGEDVEEFVKLLSKQNPSEVVERLKKRGKMKLSGFEITPEMIITRCRIKERPPAYLGRVVNDVAVLLNVEFDRELKEEGMIRELVRAVQLKRKKLGLRFEDKAVLYVLKDPVLDKWKDYIQQETNTELKFIDSAKSEELESFKFLGHEFHIRIEKR